MGHNERGVFDLLRPTLLGLPERGHIPARLRSSVAELADDDGHLRRLEFRTQVLHEVHQVHVIFRYGRGMARVVPALHPDKTGNLVAAAIVIRKIVLEVIPVVNEIVL